MAKNTKAEPTQLMVVNDSPGEECRIAILEDDRLEELYTERTSTATSVGNIYKGRVLNVEPAIQAAFVDYGEGKNGFLHISDLHPRYFPGQEVKEKVGRKIPRRQRPPIQEALKRGDEILVQVIKEGIGTKGPTLTSYLSIAGRLMVMMPHMDNVGVSRKIEDEDRRRENRKILDSLDLPPGIGFILRTAGFDRTKTDLRRDLAYLTRLWKVMEKRIATVSAPCPLYIESDVLIRTIRDIFSSTIRAIVVDSESAFDRARDFLRVIAPRSAPKVLRYADATPIFHRFDIERQIEMIHEREVPLPSGGALVIEQTEALVAVDVNSGKSRSARDSETNAYRTNCEAVDEICRQLRLRDLGGLIINDLIDMAAARHRRAIEEQFRENLKRDRARTTVLTISDFGIVEMTRQRMRPSLRMSHYQPCAVCEGRGEVRSAEIVGSDALRHVGYLLQFDRVHAVELVCSPHVASILLSNKRRELVETEDTWKKTVRVRVSETIETDRVDFFAYDERSADIDVRKLPALVPPTLEDLEKGVSAASTPAPTETKTRVSRRRRSKVAQPEAAIREMAQGATDEVGAPDEATTGDQLDAPPKKRRRRRGRGKAKTEVAVATADVVKPDIEETVPPSDDAGDDRKKSRRRRRRRGRKASEGGAEIAGSQPQSSAAESSASEDEIAAESGPPSGATKRRRRRSRKKTGRSGDTAEVQAPTLATPGNEIAAESIDDGISVPRDGAKKKRRRTRSRKTAAAADDSAQSRAEKAADEPIAEESDVKSGSEATKKKTTSKKRTRRRGPRKTDPATTTDSTSTPASGVGSDATDGTKTPDKPTVKPRRRLYHSRTKIAAAARSAADDPGE